MLSRKDFHKFIMDKNISSEYLLQQCHCGTAITVDISHDRDYFSFDVVNETSVRAKYSIAGEKDTVVCELSNITENGCTCSIKQLDIEFIIEHKPREVGECQRCHLNSY